MMKNKFKTLIVVLMVLALGWCSCTSAGTFVQLPAGPDELPLAHELWLQEGFGINSQMKNAANLRPLAAGERQRKAVSIMDLNNFFAKHGVNTSRAEDTSMYSPTPLTSLLEISRRIEEALGRTLDGASGLDLGAGKDLRVSLFMINLCGMNMAAVEKDHFISGRAAAVLKGARAQGLATDTNPVFLPETNVFDISWKEFDVVMFFYTQPHDEAKAQEFRDMIEKKAAEMKPGSILAFWFTPAQVMFAWRRLFPHLKGVYDEPVRIMDLERDVCLMVYRPPQQPSTGRAAAPVNPDSALSAI
ncbi:MAG: hypothetical protein NTV07_06750 [Candidatus Omnitrophica bacterium]|nr:hypothetical protein [Candidatus Omnitrophota bacterium]